MPAPGASWISACPGKPTRIPTFPRLLDALADGRLDRETIATKLNLEKARKDVLTAERSRLMGMLRGADLDAGTIKADLRTKVRDVTALLTRHTVQARQMLRKLLADKIELEPVGSGRQRGYRFKGILTVDRLIEGDVFQTDGRHALAKTRLLNNTPDRGGPNGPRTLLYSDIPRGYKGCIDQIALKSPAGLDSSALQSVRSSPTDVIPETPKLHRLPKKRLRGPTGSSSDLTREAGSWYEALVLVRYGEVGPPASFRNLKLLSEGDLEAYTECLLDTLPDRARIEHGPRAATH